MNISLLSHRPLLSRLTPVAAILLALAALLLLADAPPAAAASHYETPPPASTLFAASVTRDGSILTLNLSESFAAAAEVVRTTAYHLGLGDAIATLDRAGRGLQKALAEGFAAAAEVIRTAAYRLSLGDAIAALDRAGRGLQKAIAEGLATADAVRKEAQKTALEGFAAAAIPAMTFGKGLSQGLGASTGLNRTIGKGIGEPIQTTVALNRECAFTRSFAEPLKSIPSLTKRLERGMADSLDVTPAMPGRTMAKAIGEASTLTVSFSRQARFVHSFSETPRLRDGHSLASLKLFGDWFTLNEASWKQVRKRVHELPELNDIPSKTLRRELSTGLYLVDAVFRDVLFSRPEDLGLADSVSKGQFRSLAEALSLRDAAGKRLDREILETLAWTDPLSRQMAYMLALGEGAALGDADFVAKLIALLETPRLELEEAFDRLVQYRREPGEPMATTDSALKLLQRLFDEGFGQADGFGNHTTKELAELLNARPESLDRATAYQRAFIDRLYVTELSTRGFHRDLVEGWQAGDRPGEILNRWAMEWQPQGFIIVVSLATLLMVALKVSRRLPIR